MALVSCAECAREISDKALACPGCGAPRAPTPVSPRHKVTGPGGMPVNLMGSPLEAAQPTDPIESLPASSRTVYIALALLFGPLGLHDFYIGKFVLGGLKVAILAILLLMEPVLFAALFLVLYLLAVFQAFTVRRDSSGTPLA